MSISTSPSLNLEWNPADGPQLEALRKQPVEIVLAVGVDESVDVDRHSGLDVQRERVRAADDVANAAGAEDLDQLRQRRFHVGQHRVDPAVECAHGGIVMQSGCLCSQAALDAAGPALEISSRSTWGR